MKNIKDISIISFFADEIINGCPHLKENMSMDEMSDIKVELIYGMIKAVKAEIGFLGIKPPNKISITQEDVRERIEQLVEFEKTNSFQPLNDRAAKDFRKAINGTYKSWIR